MGKTIIDKSPRLGDRLPSEQEWSRQLVVSRLTVREAFKLLAYLGVVHLGSKRGAAVG